MTETKVRRLLRAFDRQTSEFVWEVDLLPSVSLKRLQTLLDVDSENPMYDAFAITLDQARTIADFTNVDLCCALYELG